MGFQIFVIILKYIPHKFTYISLQKRRIPALYDILLVNQIKDSSFIHNQALVKSTTIDIYLLCIKPFKVYGIPSPRNRFTRHRFQFIRTI